MIPFLPFFSLPILHAGGPNPGGPLYTHWALEPTVAFAGFVLVAGYLAVIGPLNRRFPGAAARTVSRHQKVCFLLGSLAWLIALGPPLDDWSGRFLLSAHMVQHLLLTLVAPPLWLLGTPAWALRPLLRWRVVDRIGYVLTRPLVAFALSGVVFAAWHIGSLYDLALRNEAVHILEHELFIGTALLAWWPVVGPLPEWPKLAPPLQCLYLFLQTVPGGIVGSFITLAAPGLYEHYVGAPRIFGISLATDQEIAGLLMWVGVFTIYLGVVTIIFFRWAAAEDAKETRPSARRSVAGRP